MNEGAGNPAPFLRFWIGANALLCGIMLAKGFPMHELRKISYYERLLTLDMPASAHFIYNHAGTMNQRGGGDTMYTSFNAYNSEVVADDVVVVGDAATSNSISKFLSSGSGSFSFNSRERAMILFEFVFLPKYTFCKNPALFTKTA